MNNGLSAALGACLVGCTVVSGAGDFRVGDAGVVVGGGSDAGAGDAASGDAGQLNAFGAMISQPTDFELVMQNMGPHAAQPVDIAVIDEENRLQSRAIVRMPTPEMGDAFPEISVILPGALTSGRYRTAFYADRNANGVPDEPPTDHSWIEPIDEEGEVEFAHSTLFDDLSEFDIGLVGDDFVVTFESDTLTNAIALSSKVLELRLILEVENRTVGSVQIHPRSGMLPEEIRLVGIVDAGNTYVIQTFADDAQVANGRQTVNAPASGDLEFTVSATTFGIQLRP